MARAFINKGGPVERRPLHPAEAITANVGVRAIAMQLVHPAPATSDEIGSICEVWSFDDGAQDAPRGAIGPLREGGIQGRKRMKKPHRNANVGGAEGRPCWPRAFVGFLREHVLP